MSRPDTLAATAHRLIDASQRILDHITTHHPEVFRSAPREDIDAYFDAARAARRAAATAPLQVTAPAFRATMQTALDKCSQAIRVGDSVAAYLRKFTDRDDCRVVADAFITHRAVAVAATDAALRAISKDARGVADDALPPIESILRTYTFPDGFVMPFVGSADNPFRAAPDPVEAEHGIDPDEVRAVSDLADAANGFRMGTIPRDPDWTTSLQKGRETSATKHTFRMPDHITLTGVTVHHHPTRPASATATGTVVDIVDPDLITIDRKHALALIGGALVLAKDLLKRNHPRNAARYRDAAVALTEALALPPLADDHQEEP